MTAQQLAAHRTIIGCVWRGHAHTRHCVQLFHVHRQFLGRHAVRFALPVTVAALVNGHQRIMINGTVGCRGARRQFGRGDSRAKFAGVRACFLQLHLHLIATVRTQGHRQPVRLITKVAVRVFHPEEDAVAGLDLIGRPSLTQAAILIGLFLLFALQLLRQRLLFLIHNFTTGHREFSIRGNANFHVAQWHITKLLLKLGRIIAFNHVPARHLQHTIILFYRAQRGCHLATE